MKANITHISQRNQAGQDVPAPVPLPSIILQLELKRRFERGAKKTKILHATLNCLYDESEIYLDTIASKSNSSVRHVQRVHKELRELGLMNWVLRYMQASIFRLSDWFFRPEIKSWFCTWLYNNMSMFRLLYVSPRDRFQINRLSPIIKQFILNNPKSALVRDVVLLINIEHALLVERIAARGPLETYGERMCKNSMRPASTGTISRSGSEATTQKHLNLYPQKGKYDGSIQSNTTIHSGNNRTLTEQVGADKTGRISGDSNSRGPERTTAQQSGPQSLCPVYEDSVGALQEQQSFDQLEASGLSQGDLPDAGECPDALGYEGDWAELFD